MYGVSKDRLTSDSAQVEFVKSPNVSGKMKPEFLVIHYTASGPAADIAGYFSRPAAKVSAHLVIPRKGAIKQCVPFNVVGWHAGRSEWIDRKGKHHVGLNTNSIGIEIENWGPMRRTGSGWVSWTGESVDAGKVIEARHKFGVPRPYAMRTASRRSSAMTTSRPAASPIPVRPGRWTPLLPGCSAAMTTRPPP